MTLPVQRAHQIEAPANRERWLVQGLWSEQAVGIVGGAPKSCKSLCALSLAVSVASGAPCLGCYLPSQTGRVLLYAAEDPLELVRDRLAGICRAGGQQLSELEIFVITAPSLRLDDDDDRTRLSETVEEIRPRLLVLDPFVRLHSGDENAVSEVAPMLDFLRGLQRRFACSVLLVHHARKAAGPLRGGQAFRGSSEFFAWTDSSLYLRRKNDRLLLTIEHRAAPSATDIPIELSVDDDALALTVVDPGDAAGSEPQSAAAEPPLADRLLAVLAEANGPCTSRELRDAVRVRTGRVYTALNELVAAGRILRDGPRYCLPGPTLPLPLPVSL